MAMDLVGTAADEVVLAAPGTVLKTSSGKIRRAANRSLYESGQIGKGYEAGWWQIVRIVGAGIFPELRRMRRSGLSGIYAAYCWLLLFLLTPVVWLSVMLLPVSRWRWTLMKKLARFLLRGSFTSLFVQGKENLPGKRSCIIVANHASYLDALIMVAALPHEFSFVAKAELGGSFLLRLFLQRIRTEFVERFDTLKGIEDARRIAAAARQGRSLLFFAEGTFTRIPGLRPFHMGAFEAAVAAGIPVVPVAVRGTRSILRGESRFPRRGAVIVTIGKPVEPGGMQDRAAQDSWKTAIKLRDAAREHILRHCGEPDLGAP